MRAATGTGFSALQACRAAELTYRRLDLLARRGVVRPSISEAQGSGTQRRYSEHDVRLLTLARVAIDAGFRPAAARWVDAARPVAVWSGRLLVARGDQVDVICAGERLPAVDPPAVMRVEVDLGRIARQVACRLAELEERS